MKAIGALILVGALVSQAIPHEVVHTRCLKLVEMAHYDRYIWITRDDVHGEDVFGCHPERFRRWLGFERMVEDPFMRPG